MRQHSSAGSAARRFLRSLTCPIPSRCRRDTDQGPCRGINASDWKKRQGLMDQNFHRLWAMRLRVSLTRSATMSRVSRLATASSEPHRTEPPKRRWQCCPIGPRSRTRSTMRGPQRSPRQPRPQRARLTSSTSQRAARCSSRDPAASGVPLFNSPLSAARTSSARVVQARTMLSARSGRAGGIRRRDARTSPGNHAVGCRFRTGRRRQRVLPELVDLVGTPEHVITVADFRGAQRTASASAAATPAAPPTRWPRSLR